MVFLDNSIVLFLMLDSGFWNAWDGTRRVTGFGINLRCRVSGLRSQASGLHSFGAQGLGLPSKLFGLRRTSRSLSYDPISRPIRLSSLRPCSLRQAQDKQDRQGKRDKTTRQAKIGGQISGRRTQLPGDFVDALGSLKSFEGNFPSVRKIKTLSQAKLFDHW